MENIGSSTFYTNNFSDSGTPKSNQFNVYDEVKQLLIKKESLKRDCVYSFCKNDRQREELFEKVRQGEIRILLGSTEKLGTGTNIQDKLLAVHHVDVPWRPSDLTQRDGRIVRQGNENKEVQIYRYVAKIVLILFCGKHKKTNSNLSIKSWQTKVLHVLLKILTRR